MNSLDCTSRSSLQLWDVLTDVPAYLVKPSLSNQMLLQELGEKACAAYLRSVFLQPNKTVFDVTALPVAELGLSMGLSSVPQLRFLRQAARQKQAGSKSAATLQPNGHAKDALPSDSSLLDAAAPMQGARCGHFVKIKFGKAVCGGCTVRPTGSRSIFLCLYSANPRWTPRLLLFWVESCPWRMPCLFAWA